MQHLPILKICSCPCQAGPKGAGLFLLSKAVNLKLSAGNGTVAFAEGQLRWPALPKRGARDITVAYVH